MKCFAWSLAIFVLFLVCASLAVAETLVVPATNATGVLSSPLVAGQVYEFKSYGVYDYSYGRWAADPEWIFFYPNSPTEYWTYGIVGGPFGEANDILDLIINDASVSWLGSVDGVTWSPHTYSPSTHAYKYYYTGTGDRVKFHIADLTPFGGGAYGDNQGFLTVEINPVPEPSSILALAGGLGCLLPFIRRRK